MLSNRYYGALFDAALDHVIDRVDLASLAAAAESPEDEAHLQTLVANTRVSLVFDSPPTSRAAGLVDALVGSAWTPKELRCEVAPDYALDDTVGTPSAASETARWRATAWGDLEPRIRVVAHTGQVDALAHTVHDEHRCGAAASLSAALLVHGVGHFDAIAARLSLADRSLTYRNLASAQERLYVAARAASGHVAVPGLVVATRRVPWARVAGSLVESLRLVGLDAELVGDGEDARSAERAVRWSRGARLGVALVLGRGTSAEPDLDDGAPSAPPARREPVFRPGRAHADHIVLLLCHAGRLHYADSAGRMGAGDAIEPLDATRLAELDGSGALVLGVGRVP